MRHPKWLAVAGGLATLASLAAIPAGAQKTPRSTATYDVVIRNGRVLDGEGNPWILADVAIKDGQFAKIGNIPAHGKMEIDARGKYVRPGWIDMMDQSGSRAAAQRPRREQAAGGRDDGDRRRGRHAGARGQVADYFAKLEQTGHQHQLRQLLQRDAGARRGARHVGARAERRGARSHARASWTRRCAAARWA